MKCWISAARLDAEEQQRAIDCAFADEWIHSQLTSLHDRAGLACRTLDDLHCAPPPHAMGC